MARVQGRYPVVSNQALALAAFAMVAVVALSNYLVQFLINDWLTYAAFTYPLTFLVTDLVNRRFGPGPARRVVFVGFLVAAALSLWLAPWQIAVASVTAFLTAQLLDVSVFDWLRRGTWWRAPLVSSVLASTVDTFIFFSIAFGGSEFNWIMLAVGDLAVKLAFTLVLLVPFRVLMSRRDATALA
ncbi:MAG: queuosine precursor transporter [Pseudomonadota bacterium]